MSMGFRSDDGWEEETEAYIGLSYGKCQEAQPENSNIKLTLTTTPFIKAH